MMSKHNRTVGLPIAKLAVAALFGLAVAGLGACRNDAPKVHSAHGIVKAVDAAARVVTLDHEEIPGVMMAMVMDFEVAPQVALDAGLVGSEVDFEVEEHGGALRVVSLKRSAR